MSEVLESRINSLNRRIGVVSPLAPSDVVRMVEYVAATRGDDEAAHANEDAVHVRVLQAIAQGDLYRPGKLRSRGVEDTRNRFRTVVCMTDIPTALTAIAAAQAQLVIATNALTATPPPPVLAAGWFISDGANCTNGTSFHVGSQTPWDNVGGDWWDKAGVKNGTASYGQIDSPLGGSLPQTWNFDVTQLAKDVPAGLPLEIILVANERYIDGIGGKKPPALLVVYADGALDTIAPVVAMVLDPSTYMPTTGPALILNHPAAFRFPALPKPATRLTLSVSSPKQWGSTAHVPVNVYRLRQPAVASAVETGLARAGQLSQCLFNMNLEIEPLASYVMEPPLDWTSGLNYDYTAKDKTKFPLICSARGMFNGDGLTKTRTVVTLPSGKKAVRFDCVGPTEANPYTPASKGQDLLMDWVYTFAPDADGNLPQEMYVQYKLMLDANFIIPPMTPQDVMGGKWGFGFSHRTSLCGNGGAFCNVPPNSGRMGWSSRNQFVMPSDPKDPAYGKMLIGSYDYNAFESQVPHMGRLAGALPTMVEVTIEKYVKMNTIDRTNGVPALSDGIERIWLNGVRILDLTDRKFRENPPYMPAPSATTVGVQADEGIANVWGNLYWGGVGMAPMHNTCYIRDVRIARAYIGPD